MPVEFPGESRDAKEQPVHDVRLDVVKDQAQSGHLHLVMSQQPESVARADTSSRASTGSPA